MLISVAECTFLQVRSSGRLARHRPPPSLPCCCIYVGKLLKVLLVRGANSLLVRDTNPFIGGKKPFSVRRKNVGNRLETHTEGMTGSVNLLNQGAGGGSSAQRMGAMI